jgi:hypothetical protein
MIHLIRGAGVPSTIPDFIGQHYIDTVGKVQYLSVGTDSIGDWLDNTAAALSNKISYTGVWSDMGTYWEYNVPLDADEVILPIDITASGVDLRVNLPDAALRTKLTDIEIVIRGLDTLPLDDLIDPVFYAPSNELYENGGVFTSPSYSWANAESYISVIANSSNIGGHDLWVIRNLHTGHIYSY